MFKLILADDESIILSQLKTIIDWNEFGFDIVGTFTNAPDAIEYIKNNEVNAIITDIKMPGPDGIALAKFCAENHPNIKITLVSAYRDFEYAQNAIRYGVTAYLTKPIIRDELKNVLTKMNEQLNQRKYETEFTDTQLQESCQQIFSDLFCGITTNISDLHDQLKKVNMNVDPDANHCALINVHIEDFNNYISNTWKHGKLRLYNAIGLLIPFETPKYYSSLVRYSQCNIEIIVIRKDENKESENIVFDFINELKENLYDVLNIVSDIKLMEQFSSISDIIKFEDTQTPITQEIIHNDTINKALSFIESDFSEISTLEDVAKYVNLNPVYFGVFFKQHVKESFTNYLNKTKIEKAKELLTNTDTKVSAVAEMVGYKSSSYFYEIFKSLTGKTPAQFKQCAQGRG